MNYFAAKGVYDRRMLISNLLLFALMIVVMQATEGAGFVLFFLLAFVAVMQNRVERLMVLMMVACCALVGNGILMPKSTVFSVTHKVMMMMIAVCLTAKLAGRRHSRFLTPFLGIVPYLLWMCVSSAQGWNPIISFLKLILFTTCYFAYYGMANTVIQDKSISTRAVRSAYLSLCCVLILGSVLLVPFPGISQMNADYFIEAMKSGKTVNSLFCGMTFQPQALGPIVSVIFIVLLCDILFEIRKIDKLMLLILICCPFLVYKTSSRTALGTLLAGTFFSLFLFMRTRRMSSQWKGKVICSTLLVVALGAVAVLASPSWRQRFASFVTKNRETTSLEGTSVAQVVNSRQGLMDRSMENFHASPLLGNGFQVSRDHEGLKIDDIRSILSAPIEKGVWVTAVLEEGGVIGLILFIGFGLITIPRLIFLGANTSAAVLFTIYVLNLGEFTIFSMSGIGGFYWFLCFVGAVFDAHRINNQRVAAVMPPGFRPV